MIWSQGIDECDRIHSAILSEYNTEVDVEEEESNSVPEKIETIGPPLILESIEVVESSRPRKVSVVARLSNKIEDYLEEVVIYSVASDIAISQSINYGFLELEIRHTLKNRRISEEVFREICTMAEKKLDENGYVVTNWIV